jgi:hypothetical protein
MRLPLFVLQGIRAATTGTQEHEATMVCSGLCTLAAGSHHEALNPDALDSSRWIIIFVKDPVRAADCCVAKSVQYCFLGNRGQLQPEAFKYA